MKSKKKKIAIFSAFFIILLSFFLFLSAKQKTRGVFLGGKEIKIERAVSDKEKYQGLSGREYLCPNCGMLFVYGDKAERTFVMRDMKIDLDIVFIADDEIVKIADNLSPEDAPYTPIKSEKPVNYVLELSAGFCEKNNIKSGDKFEL